ncbi:MAG TPA: LytR C-terminal domain-containing protein [Gemmatimonadaceae bacterium]|nr:LytR C-terminal domain-containing protein [Gemmatimonadaceae bacterium]
MTDRTVATSRPAKRRTLKRAAALGVGVLLLAGVLATRSAMRAPRLEARAPAPDVNAPADTRIRVQVLNATQVRGLARRATMQLRDRGLDVVEVGTSAEQRDSTLVLDRSGHPEWARRVAIALGGARVESRPDSSRYLDVTVLLGRAWRAPSQPFYP